MGDGSRKQGFTLVEMMVVVAIVSVLAAIAIPAVYSYQLKAKVAEQRVVNYGLADAVRAYDLTFDDFPSLGSIGNSFVPGTWPPGKTLRNWDWPSNNASDWPAYLFRPDGQVRCMYSLNPQSGPPDYMNVWSTCNVDGDANQRQLRLRYVDGGDIELQNEDLDVY